MTNKRGLFLTNVISKLFEKMIRARNRKGMKKGISEMQNGGKEGRSVIDNLMIVMAIVERNKYLQKDMHIAFIDMEKCFDKLWLEDGIKDIWKCGTSVNDAMLIKRMNESSNVVVQTPVGETEQLKLEDVVRQGTVSGPDICCSSTDQVNKNGKSIITMYGPEIDGWKKKIGRKVT